jgi:hypothetical protein
MAEFEPMTTVTVRGGPRNGDKFNYATADLEEGAVIGYLDGPYTVKRDNTGRWIVVPVAHQPEPGSAGNGDDTDFT